MDNQQDQNSQQANPVASEPNLNPVAGPAAAAQPTQPIDPLQTIGQTGGMANVSTPSIPTESNQNESKEDKILSALTRIEEKLTAISAKIGA